MKTETLIKWYVYGIGIFFLLRNVALIPFGPPIGVIFREALIIILILLLEFVVARKQKKFSVHPFAYSFSTSLYLLFLAIGILGLFVNFLTVGRFSQIIALKYYLFDYFIILYFIYRIYQFVPASKLFSATYKIGCFFAIGGIIQLILMKLGLLSLGTLGVIYETPVFETRISFIVTNPNLLALILVIALAISHKERRMRFLATDFIILIAVILTGSRLFSLIGVVLFLTKHLTNRRAIIAMVFLFLPVLAYAVLNFSIQDRILETINRRGVDPRYVMWETVIDKNINGFKWLIGNGFGNIGSYYGIENSINYEVQFKGETYLESIKFIDNTMVTILNESGLMGLSIFLLFVANNFVIKLFNKDENTSLQKTTLVIQVIIIIASFFGDVFYSYPVLFFYVATLFRQKPLNHQSE